MDRKEAPSRVHLTHKAGTHEVYVVEIPHYQHNIQAVREAKAKELASLKKFEAFQEVKESSLSVEHKKMIPAIWACAWKTVGNQTIAKARLCTRGDLENFTTRSDSPVSMKPYI